MDAIGARIRSTQETACDGLGNLVRILLSRRLMHPRLRSYCVSQHPHFQPFSVVDSLDSTGRLLDSKFMI
jgi:hypothetical protein